MRLLLKGIRWWLLPRNRESVRRDADGARLGNVRAASLPCLDVYLFIGDLVALWNCRHVGGARCLWRGFYGCVTDDRIEQLKGVAREMRGNLPVLSTNYR